MKNNMKFFAAIAASFALASCDPAFAQSNPGTKVQANQGTATSVAANAWWIDIRRISGVSFALGQNAMANSISVAIASDQSGVPVTNTGLTNLALAIANSTVPGTAGTKAVLGAGCYIAAGVTLSDGQQACLQFDINGNLKTSGTFSGSISAGATASASDPSYSAGANPLSQTLSGYLRSIVTNAGTFLVQAVQSGAWSITNISGTISLPTGASTSALQSTINTTLGTPFQAGGSIGNTTFAATQATASSLNAQVVGNIASGSADSGNPAKVGGPYNSTLPTVTNAQRVDGQFTKNGELRALITGYQTTGADGTGNSPAQIGRNGTDVNSNYLGVMPFVFNGTTWDRQRGNTSGTMAIPQGYTSGGTTSYKLIVANSNNSTSVKGSAGQVYSGQVFNNGAVIAYLKLYNKATAPTCGTDTPVKVIQIPASAASSGSGAVFQIPVGSAFSLGIGICVVTGIADNDNTSVAATTYVVDLDYN